MLAGFDRPNNRMPYFFEVLGRMFVLRRIATAHMTALHAQSQMHPAIAHLYALFADMRLGRLEFHLIEV